MMTNNIGSSSKNSNQLFKGLAQFLPSLLVEDMKFENTILINNLRKEINYEK